MKNCPSCQQVYPDDGPDFCTNDGTPLVRSVSEYNPGSTPGSQWQQPPTGWQPPQQQPPTGYGYQPQGQYSPPSQYPPPPYGYGQPSSGGDGLQKAALFTGIGATATFLIAILIAAGGIRSRDTLALVGIFGLIALLAGLTAVVLGIIGISMAGKRPGASKVKAIIGLCLGAIPILLWIIGLANSRGRF
jgi:hypothetical protein